MHKRWHLALLVFIFAVVIPGIIIEWMPNGKIRQEPDQSVPEQQSQPSISETIGTDEILLSVILNDGIKMIELEDYVSGVVLAEMPASFDTEALKAQAVVARTYVLRRYNSDGKHHDAVICAKSSCCQGYKSDEAYLAEGGKVENISKIKEAVKTTKGVVLVYDGNLIEATYFSCSGGTTEDAVAVWGEDVPYLQSTTSPGEEYASKYITTVSFTAEEFQKRLGVELTGNSGSWFGKTVYTSGSGVATMKIGGKQFTGVQLREKLDLYSTAFSMTVIGKSIVITTRGYGHRVGMSQYGADAMAKKGHNYKQILAHYYSGVEIEDYGKIAD